VSDPAFAAQLNDIVLRVLREKAATLVLDPPA
jgi:hypothetical protein